MKINTILPNGATIKRNLITENGGIILAWRDHPFHEFITWYYDGQDLKTTCWGCLLYTSPSPRDRTRSRMPSSA